MQSGFSNLKLKNSFRLPFRFAANDAPRQSICRFGGVIYFLETMHG